MNVSAQGPGQGADVDDTVWSDVGYLRDSVCIAGAYYDPSAFTEDLRARRVFEEAPGQAAVVLAVEVKFKIDGHGGPSYSLS